MNTLTAPITDPSEKPTLERSRTMLLWLAMISMVMVFGALTSAYLVKQGDADWVRFELPTGFFYSTAAILLSSLGMVLAVSGAKKNNFSLVTTGTISALLLGLVFIFLQFQAWEELVETGIYFTGTDSTSGSFLYMLTGLHMAHLAGGIIALLVTAINAYRRKYTANEHHGLRLAATFWHFLDFLWIFLFLFLLFIR